MGIVAKVEIACGGWWLLPWLRMVAISESRYESRRHDPRYQDLVHEDARRLQELCHRKRMMDRKLKWLKENK